MRNNVLKHLCRQYDCALPIYSADSGTRDLPWWRNFARIQLVSCLFAAFFSVYLTPYKGTIFGITAHLLRLFALFSVACTTVSAFPQPACFAPSSSELTVLRQRALSLQLLWFSLELTLCSVFTPVLQVALPLLFQTPWSSFFAARLFPTLLMGASASCFPFLELLLGSKNRQTLPNSELDGVLIIKKRRSSSGKRETTVSKRPISPTDSLSSDSSGGLHSGMSSPTGHCVSPAHAKSLRLPNGTADRSEMLAGPDGKASDVYLLPHTLDTNEMVFFVHKKLTPIKTRVEEKPPAPYKPLLKALMAECGGKNHGIMAGQHRPNDAAAAAAERSIAMQKYKNNSSTGSRPVIPIMATAYC